MVLYKIKKTLIKIFNKDFFQSYQDLQLILIFHDQSQFIIKHKLFSLKKVQQTSKTSSCLSNNKMPSTTNQPFVPNKKLIIHFDVDNVLQLNHPNKDLFVYELCSQWTWGKLQKVTKDDPQKVTWKLASNTLSLQQPQPQLVSYSEYLNTYVKPSDEERQKLLLNLSKGPCAKAKTQIEKNIKNITLPKTLFDVIKETKEHLNLPLKQLLETYQSGKYQILPAFYKFVMWLKKSKREFAIIIKSNNPSANHKLIIEELNLFFTGQHPLFNGKNATPLIKFDGSKGCKNFIIDDGHCAVVYQFGEKDIFESWGSVQSHQEKDIELFKQHFKSLKQSKLTEGVSNIYSHSHSILLESACIYEVNPAHLLIVDPVDYLTHEIYFTNQSLQNVKVFSCLGERINNPQSMVCKVDMFEYLKDVQYFVKQTQVLEKRRSQEIQRNQKGESQGINENNQAQKIQQQREENQQSDSEYLKRTILPVLEGALKQVTLLRPQDPLGYLALLCLKNKDRVKAPQ